MARLARNLAKWRALPRADRRSLLGLAALLPLIDVPLRLAGLRRTQAWLDARTRSHALRPANPSDIAQGERLARLAAIAGAHGLYRNTCLRQALAVRWLLRRRGLDGQLCLGARKTPQGDFEAHAWVDLAGVPLGQANLTHQPFVPAPDA